MFTDWLLIERLARELDQKIRGSRLTAIGHLHDRRIGIEFWRRGETGVLAFDLFGSLPVVTLESDQLAISSERGFIRAAGAALRGLTLAGVSALPRERVLQIDLTARSRFGVRAGYSLIAELIPRFGNLLLVKDQTIVAAYKEFRARGGGRRIIRPGARYESPPSRATDPHAVAALSTVLQADDNPDAVLRTLRAARPDLPQLLATSLIADSSSNSNARGAESAQALLAGADALVAQAQRATQSGDLYVYRDDATIVQAHLVPLKQFAALDCSRVPELLMLLREAAEESRERQDGGEPAKRRRELAKKLLQQRAKADAEVAAIDKQVATIAQRDALRAEAEGILATLHERAEHDRADAKATAASLFSRYKRLSGSAEPLHKRRIALLQRAADLDALTWELERASDADFPDVAQAAETMLGSKTRAPARVVKRRAKVVVDAPGGSRILVGRSPIENAELTFNVARPNDLWFHARNTPGAHVILQRGDRVEPPAEDLELAASLAAHFSRARESRRVDVDYTLRKHVRKRPAAAPGLVFYTEAKTLTVAPRSAPESADAQ